MPHSQSTDAPSVRESEPSSTTTRVAHVAVWLSRRSAGVGKIGLELGIAQQQKGAHVRWVCLSDPPLVEDVADSGISSINDIYAAKVFGPLKLRWSPGLVGQIESIIADAEIVHVHGIWASTSHAAAKLAKRLNRPYVLAPHGMLEPWALSHHRLRKQMVAAFREHRLVREANCIHATADAEIDGIRKFGYRGPIARIPNGLNLSHYSVSPTNRGSDSTDADTADADADTADADADADTADADSRAARRPSSLDSRRIALFLSRLHPKKGLPLYLESWAGLARQHQDWQLVIAGPDENGHRAELEAIIHHLQIQDSVTLVGPVYGDAKISLMRSSDLFVLPSHSEGFSMAVLEAMACELPVLITHGCNFPQVASEGTGLVVATDVKSLHDASASMLSAPPEELKAMGRAGRSLIERQYTWAHVAEQMEAVYRWLLDGGAQPDHVEN